MSLEIRQDENSVFVATDPDVPGLLVVSKNRDLLETGVATVCSRR